MKNDYMYALDLPTLTYRRARGDMIEVYKHLHDKYNTDRYRTTIQIF